MEALAGVVLTVIIITSPGAKDVRYNEPMPDLQTCMKEAERFLNHEFPEFLDAQQVFAGCKTPVPKLTPSRG